MKKLLMVMVLGSSAVVASAQGLQPRRLGSRLARPAVCAAQGQQTCSAQQKGAAEVAVKFGDGGYVPGLQQGVFEKFAQQFSRDFNAILKCGKTCADADRYSHAFGTILADVDVISHEVQNEQMGTVEKFNENDVVLYEGEIYLEGGREYSFFVAVDDWASIEIDGEQILKGGYWECCRGDRWKKDSRLIASKTIEKSGWHPIRVWMCDICGGGVPMLGFGGMGVGWNAEGCKELNAATFSKWQPLRDDGSGRFLRSKPMPSKAVPRCGGLLGGSLRARRLQRQQAEQAAQQVALAQDVKRFAEAERQAAGQAQREAERAEQRRQLLAIQEELKRVKEAKAAAAKSECAASCVTNKPTSGKCVVAEKLGQCDFLLNKDFKKGAKFYLCLFSASWCGPCRREMPRIAKTYAETLKGDPDIELIHFSRDQNDEKALAWAKEHDVKFPVVKPKGGNPLDLHSRGIPHLFIVKADGTLIEEGHPMNLFTDEVLRKIKEGRPLTNVATDGGINWTYEIVDDGVVLGGKVKKRAVPEATVGAIKIPETIDGKPVRGIGDMAFAGCGELVSVKIPAGVKTVGKHAFAWCGRLSKIVVDDANSFYCDVDGVLYNKAKTELIYWPRDKKPEAGAMSVEIMPSVTSIESWAFLQCNGFSSITIPSGVVRIGEYAFCACRELTSVVLRGERPNAPEKIFRDCEKLKSIHVPANAKSWAGMKEWQGIPLVFDAESK